MSVELFALAEKMGLRVLRAKHPLGAGNIILANEVDEVIWEGPSITDALNWVYEQFYGEQPLHPR